MTTLLTRAPSHVQPFIGGHVFYFGEPAVAARIGVVYLLPDRAPYYVRFRCEVHLDRKGEPYLGYVVMARRELHPEEIEHFEGMVQEMTYVETG